MIGANQVNNSTTGRTIRWTPEEWKEHSATKKCLNFMAVCFKLDEGDDELPTSQEDIYSITSSYSSSTKF